MLVHWLFELGSYLDNSYMPHDPLCHWFALLAASVIVLLRLYYNMAH